MCDDETIAAATAIIRDFARGSKPTDIKKLSLPGPENGIKQAFENELAALQARVNILTRAAAPGLRPNSPNENSLDGSDLGHGHARRARNPSTPLTRPRMAELREAAQEDEEAQQQQQRGGHRSLSAEEVGMMQDYIQQQAEEIRMHKELIADVEARLAAQQRETERKLIKVEDDDISVLRRELQKHQQANLAFQKALKEIGGVVTSVALGDLNHKVLIHKVEMDPEIATFKNTSEWLLIEADQLALTIIQ